MKRAVVAVISFCLLPGAWRRGWSEVAIPSASHYALIVGNDKYPSFSRHQWLKGCANDARLMRQYLVGQFGFPRENVRVLVNEQATRANIMDSLQNWLLAKSRPGDVLVFYWSGHGKQVRDEDGDERGEDGLDEVIAPYDFKMTSPDTAENAITDDELNAIARRAGRGRTFVAIFDCCHSGTGLRTVDGPVRVKYLYYEKPTTDTATESVGLRDLFFEPMYVEPKSRGDEPSAGFDSPLREEAPAPEGELQIALIAAARANELAAESPPVRIGDREEVHGALTLELIKAFHGEADYDRNGQVTFDELTNFLSKPIVASGNTQHPVVELSTGMRGNPLFRHDDTPAPLHPTSVALPVPSPSRLAGLEPLKVAVAPFDSFPGLMDDMDETASADLRRRIDRLAAELTKAKVVERVSPLDPYESMVIYGARREGNRLVLGLGVLDSTAQFSLRKDFGRESNLLQALRGELNRAYSVMNLMRLRQPPGARDRLDLTLAQEGRTRFRLGEPLEFRVRASHSGYLTMINVTADGQAILIYPNDMVVAGITLRSRQGFIEGGRTIVLPAAGARGKFEVTEPVGDEFIKAFLTDRPTGIFAGLVRPNTFAARPAGVDATGSIFRGLTRGLGGWPTAPGPNARPAMSPAATGIDFGALAKFTWAEASLSFVTTR